MKRIRGCALLGLAIAAAAAAACGSEPGGNAPEPAAPSSNDPAPQVGSPEAGAPSPGPVCTGEATSLMDKGAKQLAKLCARGYADPISLAFCGATTPSITSVTDVLKAVQLDFKPGPASAPVTPAPSNA